VTLERLTPYSTGGQLVGIRIDGSVFELDGLRPIGHEAPLHEGNLLLARCGIQADHGLEALRRSIIGRGQLGIVEHTGIVSAKPLRDPLLVHPSSVSAAHRVTLLLAARLNSGRFSVCGSESATQPVF
jgi:hypothetical protein